MNTKCSACIYIADSYGDNEAEMSCQLEAGHSGEHKEVFMRYDYPVTITWTVDEKELRDKDKKEYEERQKNVIDFIVKLLNGQDEVLLSKDYYNEYCVLSDSRLESWDNTFVLCKRNTGDIHYFVIKNSVIDVDFIFYS